MAIEKIHPPQLLIPPYTPRLLLCTSFFHEIPPSTFIDFATFAIPLRLFQRPWLLERRE